MTWDSHDGLVEVHDHLMAGTGPSNVISSGRIETGAVTLNAAFKRRCNTQSR
jgi:hypothetical protein